MFGAKTAERFLPAIALFELAYVRFLEREAREDAVRTLEDVTQRVHGDYERAARRSSRHDSFDASARQASGVDSARVVSLERELAQANEDARRALKRAGAVEATIASAVEQLEKAHVELHRRNESLRQKTRTIYLIDRVLTLDASTDDPRQLADGLLALVGDDMHAQRCSLMLRTPDGESLYLAAAQRHRARHRRGHARERSGRAWRDAWRMTREPMLVRDVAEANNHPLLAGSVLHDRIVHQLPARLSRRAGRRREPRQPRAARHVRRGRRRPRAHARARDRARRVARPARPNVSAKRSVSA